jgi:hypothetical protein
MSNNNDSTRSTHDEFSSVVTFLRKLHTDRYFGRVELAFQSGHVVNIKQEQSLKPADIQSLVARSQGVGNGNQQ